MGYMHIENLYKSQDILLFKECYALEKIHGTSAHIGFRSGQIHFHSGGAPNEAFVKLFDQTSLLAAFEQIGQPDITIYGEAYGGKLQRMSHTYGPNLAFIVFDVKVGDHWLSVPKAAKVAADLGLEFVPYQLIPATVEAIDAARDAPSVLAVIRGCGSDKTREGVVLRPPIELTRNNGSRIMCKHRIYEYSERKTPQAVTPEQKAILDDADAIAEEWVTPMRLNHVLDKISEPSIEKSGDVVKAMIEDVYREAVGEITESRAAAKAIGKKTIALFKTFLKENHA